ncbi:hypothetical protein ALC57_13183 [Trachymyrmex cornetzi]|uniref:Uncharacterized protein n=1 Tax=Trachymyrmex cornetzi TaxID=471704 RepID=A0A151IZT5_9HYME|nr:hypothetical protein ALC57_13183 [Trachymyrmex cornetzi]
MRNLNDGTTTNLDDGDNGGLTIYRIKRHTSSVLKRKNSLTVTPDRALFALITCASHKAGQTVSCIRCALVGTEKCRGKKNKDEGEGEAEGEADRGVNGKERPRALTAKRQFLVDDKWQATGTRSGKDEWKRVDNGFLQPPRNATKRPEIMDASDNIITRALHAMVVGIAKLGMWNETSEWTDEVT